MSWGVFARALWVGLNALLTLTGTLAFFGYTLDVHAIRDSVAAAPFGSALNHLLRVVGSTFQWYDWLAFLVCAGYLVLGLFSRRIRKVLLGEGASDRPLALFFGATLVLGIRVGSILMEQVVCPHFLACPVPWGIRHYAAWLIVGLICTYTLLAPILFHVLVDGRREAAP